MNTQFEYEVQVRMRDMNPQCEYEVHIRDVNARCEWCNGINAVL